MTPVSLSVKVREFAVADSVLPVTPRVSPLLLVSPTPLTLASLPFLFPPQDLCTGGFLCQQLFPLDTCTLTPPPSTYLLREAFVGNPVTMQRSTPADSSQIPLLLSLRPALFYT